MQTWLSRHYYPNSDLTECLNERVRPFFEAQVWNTVGARAFFVRYADEQGLHLRLRFKGPTEWLEDELIPAFDQHFQGNWREVPYVGEAQRFGGPEALALAEEHFHISSRVVLERMRKKDFSYGDAMFDAMRLNLIALAALKLDRDAVRDYFKALTRAWIINFFAADNLSQEELTSAVLADFKQAFTAQRDQISPAVNEIWKTLEMGRINTDTPEWLRWLRGNELIYKELGGNLEKALPNLLHLTNNRIGLNNQDEAYVIYMLSEML